MAKTIFEVPVKHRHVTIEVGPGGPITTLMAGDELTVEVHDEEVVLRIVDID